MATAALIILAAAGAVTLLLTRPKARPPLTVRAGEFHLALRLHTDPPRRHDNDLRIDVRDARDRPVPDVNVSVVGRMPAMGAMPEMRSIAQVTPLGGGAYRAIFDLPMGGQWTLEIAIGSAVTRVSATVGTHGLMFTEGEEAAPEEIVISAARRQVLGIRTQAVRRASLIVPIRMVGRVTFDETRLADVTMKFDGWVEDLAVNATGRHVDQGERLFSVYSPELVIAQNVFLFSRGEPATLEDARRRLELWGLTDEQIRELDERGRAAFRQPILAPVSGTVVEKNVVAGAAFTPGQRLFRLASLDPIWIEADVYESDLPLLATGQEARITLPYLPSREFSAAITFLWPYLSEDTRTGRVRFELANPRRELRPEMYASVALDVDLGPRLLVPVEAVIYTGPRRLVFVDHGEGRLRPREIRIGRRSPTDAEVLEGLAEGELVVSSGNFLVAAESRLRSATATWEEDHEPRPPDHIHH